jgi:hypothetical protein
MGQISVIIAIKPQHPNNYGEHYFQEGLADSANEFSFHVGSQILNHAGI